jgi:thiol-disulfide isomerase/thioredoxin
MWLIRRSTKSTPFLLPAIVTVAVAALIGGSSARKAPSLAGATGWLNSPPLTQIDLRGRVVLIDFWTYTCINWMRSFPYVRAWSTKYKDQGLLVIAVHTPEFGFEHDVDNVRRAARGMDVKVPIALDNDFAIWRAFDNDAWPAIYLIDAQGRIRHSQIGEGGYEETERIVQQLLGEAGAGAIDRQLVTVHPRGAEAEADWDDLESLETYLGHEHGKQFTSRGGVLSGHWTVKEQAAVLTEAGGRLTYRFHARDLHLVMGPSRPGESIRFRVSVDGQPPGAAHGLDVDESGNGTVTEHRLFQLVRQPRPVVDRLFAIEFLDAGMEAFSFTFG